MRCDPLSEVGQSASDLSNILLTSLLANKRLLNEFAQRVRVRKWRYIKGKPPKNDLLLRGFQYVMPLNQNPVFVKVFGSKTYLIVPVNRPTVQSEVLEIGHVLQFLADSFRIEF